MESSLQFTEPFCWVILEATGSRIFSVLKVWGHMMKPAIQLVAAVFRDFKIQRRDDNETVA